MKKQHIVSSADMRAIAGTNKKITAICGSRFRPRETGDLSRPICRRCMRLHGRDYGSFIPKPSSYDWEVSAACPSNPLAA